MTVMIGEYFASRKVNVEIIFRDSGETIGKILAHDEVGIVLKALSRSIVFIPYSAIDCMWNHDASLDESKLNLGKG